MPVNTHTVITLLQQEKHITDMTGGVLPDQVDDISPDHLEQLKMGYYETKVVVTPEEARSIERQTVN